MTISIGLMAALIMVAGSVYLFLSRRINRAAAAIMSIGAAVLLLVLTLILVVNSMG